MLLSVISELLPACTAFGFREKVWKETRFGQQNVIQSDNIKCLCAKSNDKKPQQILTICKIMVHSVNTADNEHSNKQQKHHND